jgi:hypothetical protein
MLLKILLATTVLITVNAQQSSKKLALHRL